MRRLIYLNSKIIRAPWIQDPEKTEFVPRRNAQKMLASAPDENFSAALFKRSDIEEQAMAKGQKRSSKEIRKPKQAAAKPPEVVRGAAMGGVFGKKA